MGDSIGKTARNLAVTGASLSAGLTAPIVAAGAAVFKVGADFESAFTGVIKTFSGTAAEAEVLRQGIRDMAMELPATAVEIAAVAESAGALGIAGENVLSFTRTVIDMAEATDLTADQAANDMARIANIMQMPQTEFERMGSTIVALGNSGASTESEIVSMAERIAGAGAVIGLTEAQVLGWASAMSSVGINAEAGGTAFSRVVVDIAKDVQTGGKNLSKFAKIAGVSSDAFVKAFEEDASAATLTFVEGLGEIADAGGNVFGVLEELELSDVRVQDTLLRLAGAGDLVTSSLQTANTAWEENLALSREAELRYGTTESKVKILKNTLNELGISLFDTFKPKIDAALDSTSAFAAGLGDTVQQFATAHPEIVNAALAFAGVLAAAGPVLLLFSGLAAALGFLLSPIGLVVAALASLAAGLAYLDTLGVIDLTTMWSNVTTAIQGAIDTLHVLTQEVADWRTQIETQGLISEETFIATWELPPAAREFMQFVIGLGAAFKTLKAAVTGEDLGAGRIRELTTILESAFGSEIATRIQNIAFHIESLRKALAGETTIGGWVERLGVFGKNVGVEVKAIGVEIKKQVEAQLIELKIGETLIGLIQVQIDKIPWPSLRFDLSAAIATMQIQLATFSGLVRAAWMTEGWSGLGALAAEKISALYQSIREALMPAVPTAEVLREGAPPTALQTSWQVWRDQMLADMTTTIETFDFTKMAVGILAGLTIALATGDYSGVGAALGTGLKRSFASGAAAAAIAGIGLELVNAIIPSIGPAIRGITWVISSGNFAGFKTAVINAFTGINWTGIQLAATNLRLAINNAFGRFLGGMITGTTGWKQPQWMADLLAWEPSTPQWVTSLLEWEPSVPQWVSDLIGALAKPAGPVGPQTGAGTLRDSGRPWTGGGFGPFERPLEMPGHEFDFPLKAMITEVEPSATLKPLQIKGIMTEVAEAGMGAGDALTKGAATIGSTLSGFSWPDMPVWEWPALPGFKWPAYNPWIWPPIQAPDWLNRLVVPRPSWLGELLSWSPTVQIRQAAVTVPGQISAPPATVSAARAGEGEIGAASVRAAGVTIGPVYVNSELDIEAIAYRVTQLQNQRG